MYNVYIKRKEVKTMTTALIFVSIWILIGLSGSIFDDYFEIVNVPIIIFMVLLPFFPFIFHWCGLF